MTEDTLPDDTVEELPAEQPAESKFTLTPRMQAIARGEDPDAVQEPVAEEVEEQAEEVAEEVAEVSEEKPVEQPTSWVTDSDRLRAASYNLTAEDLAAFESREEFGRALRAYDRAATRSSQLGNIPQKETEAPAKEPEAVDDTKPVDANGKLNLAYYEKNFDEGTVEAMRVLRAQQDANEKLAAANEEAQRRYEEEQWNRHIQEFHKSAEEMRPDFFGRTVDKSGLPIQLTQAELDRRQKLFGAADVIIDHMIREQDRQGLPPSVPPWPVILKQAEQLAFRDELAAHEKAAAKAKREAELKRVAASSQRRRPVATTAGSHAAHRNAPPADPYSTQSIMQVPEVAAVLQRIHDGASRN